MNCKKCSQKTKIINHTLAAQHKSKELGNRCIDCRKPLTEEDLTKSIPITYSTNYDACTVCHALFKVSCKC